MDQSPWILNVNIKNCEVCQAVGDKQAVGQDKSKGFEAWSPATDVFKPGISIKDTAWISMTTISSFYTKST